MFKKLVMVSIYSNGVRVTDFVMGNYDPYTGKTRVPLDTLFDIFEKGAGFDISRGETYCIGC
jgi:hypothetical protein